MLTLEPTSYDKLHQRRFDLQWFLFSLCFYCILRAQLQKWQKAMMDAACKRTLHTSFDSEMLWLDETIERRGRHYLCTDRLVDETVIFYVSLPSLPPPYTSSLPHYLVTTSSLSPHCLLTTSSLPRHYLVATSSLPRGPPIFKASRWFACIIMCLDKMKEWRVHALLADADKAEGLV